MIRRWLSRRTQPRQPNRLERRAGRIPQRPRLSVTLLEGRATPSTTAGDHWINDTDPLLDALAFRFEAPKPASPWAVPLDYQENAVAELQEPTSSATPITVAAFALLFLGSEVASPYDREEDAATPVELHGVSLV